MNIEVVLKTINQNTEEFHVVHSLLKLMVSFFFLLPQPKIQMNTGSVHFSSAFNRNEMRCSGIITSHKLYYGFGFYDQINGSPFEEENSIEI